MAKASKQTGNNKKARAHTLAMNKLNVYPRIAAIVLATAGVVAFLPWLCIYNTDIPGIEIKVSGWASFFCGLTGKLTTAGSVYGNMDVFNYYAPDACKSLALYGVITYVLVIAAFILNAVMLSKKAKVLNCVAAVLGVAASVFTILGYSAAMAVNQSDIIETYCSGNPACSVKSYAIFTAVLLLIAAVINLIAGIKYFKAQKLIKA